MSRKSKIIVNVIHNNIGGELNRRPVELLGDDYDQQRMAQAAIELIRESVYLEVGDTIVIGEEVK